MKNNTIMIAGSLLLTSILTFSFYGIGQSLASGNEGYWELDDDDDDYRHSSTIQNPLYAEECGSCHMAYPAQLLPGASWRRVMQGLDQHFGENAEVDATTGQAIEKYLLQTSDSSSYRKLFRNLGDRVPLRITDLPYFIHEHDEIPSRFIQANDKVGSISQCNACHQNAERGQFDEDNVFIPGFGRWDD
ncbi:MAG: diacylglycerol kinase [Gammaproteobacteria bacterium]|nr:diacylglycerol kinase [Gammaproteobacteria bacterium]